MYKKTKVLSIALFSLFSTSTVLASDISLIIDTNKFDAVKESIAKQIKQVTPLREAKSRVVVDSDYAEMVIDYLANNEIAFNYDMEFSGIKDSFAVADSNISGKSTYIFNDPLIENQTTWFDGVNNIYDGVVYEKSRDNKKKPVIVFLDTGALQHDDIQYKGGYNFATYYYDEQDSHFYTREYYDDYSYNQDTGLTCSSGHGLAMAGVSAKQNNNYGIAGIVEADLYMARVMETNCQAKRDVGYLFDVNTALERIYADFAKPENSSDRIFPVVDVVNISLASEAGTCPKTLQDNLNKMVSIGIVPVVSAGNYGKLALNYAPANCDNVIVVGASDSDGNVATYSNYGDAVDVYVNGMSYTLSSNNGEDEYTTTIGTSGAASKISALVALIKSKYPTAQFEQIETLIKGTAKNKNLDALALMKAVDQYYANEVDFSHVTGNDCVENNKATVLGEKTDICSTLMFSGNFPLKNDASYPVDYTIQLKKRDALSSQWGDAKTVKEINVSSEQDGLAFIDDGESDYGLFNCFDDAQGKKVCAFSKALDRQQIVYPDTCN
jgi:hypothetical protein